MEENMNNQEQQNATTDLIATKKKLSAKAIAVIVVALVLVIAILITAFAIGKKNKEKEEAERAERIREVEFGFAKGAYNKLNSVSETTDEIMDGIYNAWYFAIYEADDYWQEQKIIRFARKIGATYDEVEAAMEKMDLMDGWSFTALEDFSSAVYIALEVYEEKGLFAEADEDMEYVKTMLQKISSENHEYTKHSELTDYYSAVLAYYEFAKSPSGTLKDLSNTITNYQTKIIIYKNSLGVTFK